ncbi:aspartic peptidase domain-containing protein [Russula emetica]|nr:aspartic peptidase domain-containing protein [Russula emetica]
MLLLAPLAPFVVLATRVVAGPTNGCDGPIVSASITKRIFNTTGTLNVVQHDNRRSRFLLQGGQCDGSLTPDVPLNDAAIVYTAEIGFGVPLTLYQLIVDTGSSNTWVGANKSYIKTKTSMETSNSFNVTYGSGQVNGTEFIDTVTIAPGAIISRQSIGVASNTSATGFFPFDGILGIGPRDLTLNTTFPDNSSIIPTVTDNLVQQGTIKQNVVAVSFEPANSTADINLNGELTFGGTNPANYIGNITYHNLTTTAPASQYFGVDASFQYNNETILNTSAGIVDTGTTLILLNTSAYDRYAKATGAVYDNTTQSLRISSAQYSNLQSLFFTVDGNTYELNPNAQIFPRTFNTLPIVGGDADHLYLVVSDLGPQSSEIGFIAGMAFIERFYSVFDNDYGRVGFANTQFTNATDIN